MSRVLWAKMKRLTGRRIWSKIRSTLTQWKLMMPKPNNDLTADEVRELFDYDPDTGILTYRKHSVIKKPENQTLAFLFLDFWVMTCIHMCRMIIVTIIFQFHVIRMNHDMMNMVLLQQCLTIIEIPIKCIII